MLVSSNLRDKRALVLRLIMAEALAKPGKGPLALRLRVRPTFVRAPRAQVGAAEPKDPVP
jgi:hypothetical protein